MAAAHQGEDMVREGITIMFPPKSEDTEDTLEPPDFLSLCSL